MGFEVWLLDQQQHHRLEMSEMRDLRPHPKHVEATGVGPSKLCENKPSRLKFEDYSEETSTQQFSIIEDKNYLGSFKKYSHV